MDLNQLLDGKRIGEGCATCKHGQLLRKSIVFLSLLIMPPALATERYPLERRVQPEHCSAPARDRSRHLRRCHTGCSLPSTTGLVRNSFRHTCGVRMCVEKSCELD